MLTGESVSVSVWCCVTVFHYCRAYHGHLSTLLSLSTYKLKSVGPHCIQVYVLLVCTHTHIHTHVHKHTHTHTGCVVSCYLEIKVQYNKADCF